MNTTAQYFYARNLLAILKKNCVHQRFATKTPMQANRGVNITWRYFDPLTVPSSALTEGTAPTASYPALTEVSATLTQEGAVIDVSDFVGMFDEHGALLMSPDSAINVELIGQQAAQRLDDLAKTAMTAGTNVYYSGAPTVATRLGLSIGNKVSEADFRAIVRSLRQENVKPIAPMIAAGVGQGTIPVAPSFIGIIGPETEYDITQLDSFLAPQRYGNIGTLYEDEVGALPEIGIRFIRSTNNKTYSAGAGDGSTVHATIVFGQDAYGVPEIEGAPKDLGPDQPSVQIFATPPGGHGDELHQRASMGWKAYFACKILRSVALVRYEHCVTA